jgi:hypothetical protein
LAQLPTLLNVVGWYFPVEIDPTWADTLRMAPLLAQLLRPLWVSVYYSTNVGADVLTGCLVSWLPPDAGVFFEDGVGVHGAASEAKEIWSIRVRLQLARRVRDFASFNLALDSKLRACDLVALRVDDVALNGRVRSRSTVMHRKTGRSVQFEITEQTREAVGRWIGKKDLHRVSRCSRAELIG